MFSFKPKKTEVVEPKFNQDLEIISQMNQEFALSLDLNETLQTALKVIIQRISAKAANVFLINDSIKQNIILGQEINEVDDNEIVNILNKVKLGSMLDNSKHGIDTIIGERGLQISGGQRQRIGLARALFRDFSVLILDEATSALDSKTEEQIMEIISEIKTNKVIIMISHNRKILKDCDKVFKLDNGFLNLQTGV